jgi:putative ABC transport system permease protein
MIGAYWKYLRRNLSANKTYSFLNIAGLSAGLTCFALIFLWVADEISYDRFNENYGRIVRLISSTKTETGIVESAVSAAPMAKALKDDYAEVENTVRLRMHEEIRWVSKQSKPLLPIL